VSEEARVLKTRVVCGWMDGDGEGEWRAEEVEVEVAEWGVDVLVFPALLA
jgi:hypothetical protein